MSEDRGVKWFGTSWGAPICREDCQQPVPVGKPCVVCQKSLTAGDRGLLIWHMDKDSAMDGYRPFHLDCFGSTIGGCMEEISKGKMEEMPKGATCEHENMIECCEGCGHFSCSCGLTWDENAEGEGFSLESVEGPNQEDFE